MTAHIIYYNYLTPNGKAMSIGGIQTYITNLLPVISELGYRINIYQRSEHNFCIKRDDADIYGIAYTRETWGSAVAKHLVKNTLPHIDASQDILIYGCETCITRRVSCPTIAIQHGIFWDVEDKTPMSKFEYLKKTIRRLQTSWNTVQRATKADTLVCVDHNFVNWHRAVCVNTGIRHFVVPNFSHIPETRPFKKNDTPLRIIFARRLFIHRGTRIFTNAIIRIINEYPNIEITIAGDGPDAPYMHEHLDSYSNVRFIKFASKESLQIHQDKDIAIIPTIGSEGTSLSLLEAMASGCAVVCTNVGGMTNIVLDHYNGLMINPNEDSLHNAIKLLIESPTLRASLQKNAYETVKESFSLALWKERWKQILIKVKQSHQ